MPLEAVSCGLRMLEAVFDKYMGGKRGIRALCEFQ